MGSLVSIGQVLLVPRQQVIHPMDQRGCYVQRVAFRRRARHDAFPHQDRGDPKHLIIEGKLLNSRKHRECRRPDLFREVHAA